jgi:hypothetical protein
MVLTVSFALSSVTGLSCHRRSWFVSTNLAPASGRQDHATSPYAAASFVRAIIALTLQRPSHPAPNVRDDREPPLLWVRDGDKETTDLGPQQSGIFFASRLDDPNQIESAKEIEFYAHVIFSRPGRFHDGASFGIDLICPSGRSGDQRRGACRTRWPGNPD